MSDPTRLSEEEQAKATLRAQTEEINRLERVLSQQYGQEGQSIAEIDEPVAPREKLFSRRTLFGWAFATLLVVFIIRMVLPVVFETVKESVVTGMKESMGNTPVVAPAPPTVVIPAPAVPEPPVVKVEVKKVTR